VVNKVFMWHIYGEIQNYSRVSAEQHHDLDSFMGQDLAYIQPLPYLPVY